MNKCMMVLLVLFVQEVSAQGSEPVSASFAYGPQRGQDSIGSLKRIELSLFLPIYQAGRLKIGAGIRYSGQYNSLLSENFGPGIHSSSVIVGGSWREKHGNTTTIAFSLIGGSDKADPFAIDPAYSVTVLRSRKYSEKLRLGFGLAYIRQNFGHQVIPLVEFNFKPGGKWHLHGRLPVKGRAAYALDKRTMTGVGWDLLIGTYQLSSNDVDKAYIKQVNPIGTIFLDRMLVGRWRLNLQFGYRFLNRYQLFGEAARNEWYIMNFSLGPKQHPAETLNMNGLLFKSGLSISFH